MEKHGIPTVTLVTAAFAQAAASRAASLGLEDLAVTSVAHPLASRATEELAGLADAVYAEIVARLTAGV